MTLTPPCFTPPGSHFVLGKHALCVCFCQLITRARCKSLWLCDTNGRLETDRNFREFRCVFVLEKTLVFTDCRV